MYVYVASPNPRLNDQVISEVQGGWIDLLIDRLIKSLNWLNWLSELGVATITDNSGDELESTLLL